VPQVVFTLDTVAAKMRFMSIVDLKPSHLTKLLFILAILGAPFQQYLRPLVAPVLVPYMEHFPPPSFTRLIRATRAFKATDRSLLDAIITRVVKSTTRPPDAKGGSSNNGGSVVTVPMVLSDWTETLRTLCNPDCPLPSKHREFLDAFMAVCLVDLRLRPGDMCSISGDLGRLLAEKDLELDADYLQQLKGTYAKVLESFAERLNVMLKVGILSLTHADIFDECCRKYCKSAETLGPVTELRETRKRINADGGGDDEYLEQIPVDVRDVYHKILTLNNWNTYGAYKPLPGLFQVDFKQALTGVGPDVILHAVHLFEQCYPGQLLPVLDRLLSRAIAAKLNEEGEEVVSEDGREWVLRSRQAILFSKEGLQRFANMLVSTPLAGVRQNPMCWELVRLKAQRLGMSKVEAVASQKLASADT